VRKKNAKKVIYFLSKLEIEARSSSVLAWHGADKVFLVKYNVIHRNETICNDWVTLKKTKNKDNPSKNKQIKKTKKNSKY